MLPFFHSAFPAPQGPLISSQNALPIQFAYAIKKAVCFYDFPLCRKHPRFRSSHCFPPRFSQGSNQRPRVLHYSLFPNISQGGSLHKPTKTLKSLYVHLSKKRPTRCAAPNHFRGWLTGRCCQNRPLPAGSGKAPPLPPPAAGTPAAAPAGRSAPQAGRCRDCPRNSAGGRSVPPGSRCR